MNLQEMLEQFAYVVFNVALAVSLAALILLFARVMYITWNSL